MNLGQKLELINPANGEKFRELPYHNWDEAKSLLVKAGNTQKQWKPTEISERIHLVKLLWTTSGITNIPLQTTSPSRWESPYPNL